MKIDINEAWAWPKSLKLAACGVVSILVAGLGVNFFVKDQWKKIEKLEKEEISLKKDFDDKAFQAANLEPLKKQLAEMEQMLRVVVRQLPSKTQMANTIVDISQVSLKNGIQSELFKPGDEVLKDFYAEKPINIRMVGDYHQFGGFSSDVASLARVVILTMDGVSLTLPDDLDPTGKLVLEGKLTTYRYLDDSEIEAQQASKDASSAPKQVSK